MQRQQENRLIPLVDKAVRLIFQKVCLYFFVNRSNDLISGLADFRQGIRKSLAGCVTGICCKPQELFQDTQFRLNPFQVPVLEPVCLEIVQKVWVPYLGKLCSTYAFQIKKKPADHGTVRLYGSRIFAFLFHNFLKFNKNVFIFISFRKFRGETQIMMPFRQRSSLLFCQQMDEPVQCFPFNIGCAKHASRIVIQRIDPFKAERQFKRLIQTF